ncbi:MAG: 30S ribosomal protein S2 [Elusimicrobiales bacterium]|nr:30S ribosomal protein S2 [Elusimicrobiales bacterium]
MFNVTMKTMLEAGVHFGHQTSKWNPKMSKYIFGERNGIHILDLQKTIKEFKKAYEFVYENAKNGKSFIFVGTKKQAKEIIKAEAERAQVACVYEKWRGGMLTNFETIKMSIRRLEELEEMENKGYFKVMSKKEVSRLTKEKNRLLKFLSGIRNIKIIPDIMFVIDPVEEYNAVREAKKLGIPIVAVCDTNADPDEVDVIIPGNDDAARSIKLFCSAIADAVIEGKKVRESHISGEVEKTEFTGASLVSQDIGENITEESENFVPTEEDMMKEAQKEEIVDESVEEDVIEENNK